MKTVHIAVIALLGVGIAIAVSLFGNTSEYVTFDVAKQYAELYPNKEIHVVGTLNKEKPMVFNPMVNANKFEFYMNDTLGNLSRVIYYNSKPQDIEKTERIVCIGKYNGEVFEASQILSKCPSKYNDEITGVN